MPTIPSDIPLLAIIALSTLLPFIIAAGTCYLKISVVLIMVRNAMGVQQVPSSLALNGIALLLSLFVMMPVIQDVHQYMRTEKVDFSNVESMDNFVEGGLGSYKAYLKKYSDPELLKFFESVQQGRTQVATKVGSKAANLSKPLAKFAGKADDVVKVADTANNVGKVGNAANVTARQAELGLNGTSMALGVTNAAVSGGLNLHASAQIRDMKELMADMLLNNAALQAIDELLKALIKGMSKEYDQINEMFEGMLTALNESGHAKANMMKSSFA